MNKNYKWIYFINAIILPLIPMLFLYNQNFQYLYLPQVVFVMLILVFTLALYYGFCSFVFKSNGFAFLSCVFFVVILFAYNNLYDLYRPSSYSRLIYLIAVPALAYVFTYIFYKIFRKRSFEKAPVFITSFVFAMLIMNIFPLIQNRDLIFEDEMDIKHKTDFNVDLNTKSPNVYWILCDGMLGFDAMEKYFQDHQEELTEALKDRGFFINKGAMLEAGHLTRIAIPTLMNPEYHDKYMKDRLINHEEASKLRNSSDIQLYSARVNNETIRAFDEKNYSTIAISLNDRYFLPNTDYFYYLDVFLKEEAGYRSEAKLVKKDENASNSIDKSRIYAHQLGEIFLGGIPGLLYDKFFINDDLKEIELSYIHENKSDILLDSEFGKIHNALIDSLYDSLKLEEDSEGKFIVVHNLIAHGPFIFDEDGKIIDGKDNVLNYPGHHTYSAKVLVNILDMILEEDPKAVIVLQADHGLHLLREDDIERELRDKDAAIDIWNNVFSAIRIPKEYQNVDENHVLYDPRNISRYLINNYVGENYDYIID